MAVDSRIGWAVDKAVDIIAISLEEGIAIVHFAVEKEIAFDWTELIANGVGFQQMDSMNSMRMDWSYL